ncbi:molybdopterin dinucleotide binding domain-containing protein, partial [Variovorax humicola]
TNSERRISRVRPAVAAPGAARHDWSAAVDFAQRLESRLPRRATPATLFAYALDAEAGAEAIWNEHRETTRGRDLDITGLSWPLLDAQGPQQWPLPEGQASGRARLYEDGIYPTPDGRARFIDTPYKPVAEQREARYPFSLNTGRLRDQWHGMSRTGTLGRLFGHVPEPVVQMHGQDMARRQIKDGDLVHVTSRRGSIVLPAQASAEVGMSQAFVAMHWGEEYLSGRSSTGAPLAGINALTSPAFCPDSKQPELKHAAIKVLKAELPWSLLAAAWLPNDQALGTLGELCALMKEFPFASCVPFGTGGALASASASASASAGAGASGSTSTSTGTTADSAERTGVLFRAAGHDAAPEALLTRIEALMGLSTADTLRYADARHGQRRAARLVRVADTPGEARLEAFLLAGDTRAEGWIKALLQDRLPAQAFGRQLLRPGSTAPIQVAARGKIVCNCFGVTETAIGKTLQGCTGNDGQRLAALQGALQCGTNCGSCLPELQRMVRASAPERAEASP